jgi:5-methylcytosine-specific restriction endonuclease McrA
MANKRSDIAKLVSAARKVWRESENYKAVKKAAAVPGKTGWFMCRKCQVPHEVIKIDHIDPIGKQPTTLEEFGQWLVRLFCAITNLQPLCNGCHNEKTKAERKAAAEERKRGKRKARSS